MKFHCVYAVNIMASEWFEIIAIYSKLEDAQAYRDKAIEHGAVGCCVQDDLPLEQIKADLLRERLGVLHDVLLRLEAKTP